MRACDTPSGVDSYLNLNACATCADFQLTRDFLHATFEVLKNNGWEQTLVSSVSQLVQEEVMDAGKEENPDGLRLHLADIYLEELAKVGADQVCWRGGGDEKGLCFGRGGSKKPGG